MSIRTLVLAVTAATVLAACGKSGDAAAPGNSDAKSVESKGADSAPKPAVYDPNLKPGKVTWDPESKKNLEARGFKFDENGVPIAPPNFAEQAKKAEEQKGSAAPQK